MSRFVAACVQMTSGADVAQNLEAVSRLSTEARRRGADLIVLPENFAFMGLSEKDKFPVAESLDGDGPILRTLRAVATRERLWVIAGGLPERSPDPERVWNTLVAVSPEGQITARYRKVHLFDVDIPGGAQFKESATVAAGKEPLVLETPLAPIGLSICYDLRFPELYRALVDRGARAVVVPAAFTQHTGKDHWHPLLRARAIENQVWVLAAGQYGRHNEKRVTYGHSLICDPWGTVVAEASDDVGLALAEIDLAFQEKVRKEMPCLSHRRL